MRFIDYKYYLITSLIFSITINFKLKSTLRSPELDINNVIQLEFDAPEKPGEKETLGVIAIINILDHNDMTYKPFRFLIDSLTSAFWLISSHCETELCNDHKKYLPAHQLQGDASIVLNNGKINGNIYFTSINLKSFNLDDQSMLLVNSISIPEFGDSKIDGVLGISKVLSNLHINHSYTSLLQNILNKKLPPYMILRLGGSDPYMKFGEMNRMDWQYIKDDLMTDDYTERIEWLNLIEKGKLVLPLRHIRLIYRNEQNQITRWEFALTTCVWNGCRATLDTKSYFIYGPSSQLNNILKLNTRVCSKNHYKNLPDIEFSFYDINLDHTKKLSGLTVDVTLEPEDYMISRTSGGIDDGKSNGNDCIPGFGNHGAQYGWNLGILFMKKVMVVYDFKNDKMGFVRANNDY